MPEGPELLRSRDFLEKAIVGKTLMTCQVLGGRYEKHAPEGLSGFLQTHLKNGGTLVEEVRVKGKFMWWRLNAGEVWYMWCTYGMSGQWSHQKTKHSAVEVGYAQDDIIDGTRARFLYFNDPRHFGTLKFVNDPAQHAAKLKTLGPDMLSDPPDELTFSQRLHKRGSKTIAEVLMDQNVVSGVGNYIKAEALYLAEISPHRVVNDLKPSEVNRLREQIINVMKASYNTGGATISTYRNVDGSVGDAQRRFVVYGHSTDPFGNPVVKEETLDGRTTHWVPTVQR